MTERLSHRLANFKLSDAVITALAERVLIDGLSIGRFDPCIYGICVDYFTNKPPRLDHFNAKLGIAKWEVFPYGIIDWDRFHVRVAFSVDEPRARVDAWLRRLSRRPRAMGIEVGLSARRILLFTPDPAL
jgi:hypothetical protein